MCSLLSLLNPVQGITLLCLIVAANVSVEAVLLNGEHVTGTLTFDKGAGLRFAPDRPGRVLPFHELAQVRFPASNLPPFRIAAPFRVTLRDGQFLTGQLLDLDDKQLHFRTAWAENLTVSHEAVRSVMQAPPYLTVFQDGFESGLKRWRLAGRPELIARPGTSGGHCLRLRKSGQSAELRLAGSLTAGRIGVNFCESGPVKGAVWKMEAEFAGSQQKSSIVRAIIATPAREYQAELSGSAGAIGRLPSHLGWHRLTCEFSQRALSLAVDEDILCSVDPWASGALRQIKLVCIGAPGDAPASGEVLFDAFSVARTLPRLQRPKGEASQDELWLLSGDQLFGSISHAGQQSIELRAGFGVKILNWADVRAIYFPAPGRIPQAASSGNVRVWLQSGLGREPDELAGVVTQLDDQQLHLQHYSLGLLKIDLRRLHRLAPGNWILPTKP